MWLWVIFLCTTNAVVNGAKPDPPEIPTIGITKLAKTSDCSKPVAFSVTKPVIGHEGLSFQGTLLNSGVGYSEETGIFTTYCPGLYQFSYFFKGSSDLRMRLIHKNVTSNDWKNVLSGGNSGAPLNGNIVILRLALGDQIKFYAEGQKIDADSSFSGYRIAKE